MSGRYERRWTMVWSGLACPILLAGLVMGSWVGVIGLYLVAFMFSAAICGSAPNTSGDLQTVFGGISARQIVGPALRWAAIVSAVVVTAVVSAWLALLVVVAVVLTSPRMVLRLRPRRPQQVDDVSPEHLRSLVRQLDVAGLCWAWRSSHGLLEQVHDVEARGKVVMLRQLYLDEMERRDATGFHTWLEVARAAEGPEAYLSERPGGDGAAAA